MNSSTWNAMAPGDREDYLRAKFPTYRGDKQLLDHIKKQATMTWEQFDSTYQVILGIPPKNY